MEAYALETNGMALIKMTCNYRHYLNKDGFVHVYKNLGRADYSKIKPVHVYIKKEVSYE